LQKKINSCSICHSGLGARLYTSHYHILCCLYWHALGFQARKNHIGKIRHSPF